MTELCKRFEKVITNYRAGQYGSGSMYLNEIMEKANEPDLLGLMNESELKYLVDNGFMSRMMYSYALDALKSLLEEENAIEFNITHRVCNFIETNCDYFQVDTYKRVA